MHTIVAFAGDHQFLAQIRKTANGASSILPAGHAQTGQAKSPWR